VLAFHSDTRNRNNENAKEKEKPKKWASLDDGVKDAVYLAIIRVKRFFDAR
jgi:hypothetical protein